MVPYGYVPLSTTLITIITLYFAGTSFIYIKFQIKNVNHNCKLKIVKHESHMMKLVHDLKNPIIGTICQLEEVTNNINTPKFTGE